LCLRADAVLASRPDSELTANEDTSRSNESLEHAGQTVAGDWGRINASN
jgi:hypothetical protein